MAKLTIEDLKRIRDQHKAELTLREGGSRAKVTVHMGTCGIAAGARDVMETITAEIAKAGITDVIVTNSGCAGLCSKEPMITVEVLGMAPVKYAMLDKEKVARIFKEHIIGGTPVEELALVMGSESTF